MKRIPVIDSHTGGEPTRVILGGISIDELETYRRGIVGEPRGHDVIVGALLEQPTDPTCIAKVTFFNNVGRLGMCGHGMIGLIATLKHLQRISPGTHRVETPAGVVTTTLHADDRVSVGNVLSYRKAANVRAGGVCGDVAYGGNWFYLVADHGLSLEVANVPALTQACLAIRSAVRDVGYPEIDHIELFGPARSPTNHCRNFVLCPGDQYDRSPCGTGTSAKLACLAADDQWPPSETWRQESVIGSVFEGYYQRADGGILPTISGYAYITAESELVFDPRDPYCFSMRAATSEASLSLGPV